MQINAANAGMSAGIAQMGGRRPPGPPDASEVFSRIDANGDQSVNLEELQAFADKVNAMGGADLDATEMLNSLDADGDGVVSEDEAVAGLDQFMPKPPEHGGGPTGQQLLEGLSGGDSKLMLELINSLAANSETGTNSPAEQFQELLASFQTDATRSLLDVSA